MENKKELSKNFWYMIIGICSLLIVIIIIAFVVFANRKPEVVEKNENGANIVLNYSSDVSGLKLTELTPTTDAVGMKNSNEDEYFDFSVEVALDNARGVEYEISAIKDTKNSNISDDDIKIYLEKEKSGTYTKVFGPEKFKPLKKKTEIGSEKGSMVLTKTKKTNSIADNYRLRVWLSDKSNTPSGNYSIKIVVNGKAK